MGFFSKTWNFVFNIERFNFGDSERKISSRPKYGPPSRRPKPKRPENWPPAPPSRTMKEGEQPKITEILESVEFDEGSPAPAKFIIYLSAFSGDSIRADIHVLDANDNLLKVFDGKTLTEGDQITIQGVDVLNQSLNRHIRKEG